MVRLFKATAALMVVTAAAASGAEAVSVGWMPASDRFAAPGKGWSTIEILLLALAYKIGFLLTFAVVIKAVDIGQDILSFFWSCLCRRKRKKSIGICR